MIDRLRKKEQALAVVGLGYVGLPLAVAFADEFRTIGFDSNRRKIDSYRRGVDVTEEVGDERLKMAPIEYTEDPSLLRQASFIIVAVPTPVNGDKTPDLTPVTAASRTVGQYLSRGSIVVFESTVYPGVTEDICVPILEEESGLVCGQDFTAGYSPERINPGDKVHRLENIKKIVSASDEKTLNEIATVYASVIKAGVYRAPSIKVAEAAKLVENAQRDINIAFMNELAMVFDRMGIATNDVWQAMQTKWNALPFRPGLVGGHCIGVDPWYFVYEAENLGYHSQIIAAGRRVNDGMGEFVADKIIKNLIKANIHVRQAKIYLCGVTFKEDCPDIRNSRSFDVWKYLAEYGVEARLVDPIADKEEVRRIEGVELFDFKDVKDADCLVFLVGHEEFRQLSPDALKTRFKAGSNVVLDVKSIFVREAMEASGYFYWSL